MILSGPEYSGRFGRVVPRGLCGLQKRYISKWYSLHTCYFAGPDSDDQLKSFREGDTERISFDP